MPIPQVLRNRCRWLCALVVLGACSVVRANCNGSTPVPLPADPACQANAAACACLANVAPTCQPTGLVLDAFIQRGACGKFGKPLTPVRPRLSVVGGTYQTFENGEIAAYTGWDGDSGAQTPGFVLSGALDHDKIDVEWGTTKPFSYEYFVLRWDIDDHSENVDAQHEDDKQQEDVKSPGSSGRHVFDAALAGTYVVYVEGCEKTGLIFKSAKCRQGWSHPVYVDHLRTLNFARSTSPCRSHRCRRP